MVELHLTGVAAILGASGPMEALTEFKIGYPLLCAMLVGCVFGFVLSIPVGPINLTILNEGSRNGFKWAMLIGAGATLMEVVYCAIAFASVGSIYLGDYVKAGMELVTFVFLIFLGIRFLLAKSVRAAAVPLGETATRIEEQIEERLHPHSAFMTGFVRVMCNLGVLVFWMIAAASLISHEWVQAHWPGKLSCIFGVAIGTGLWFVALSFGVSRGHGKFSEKTLLRMEHFSGICLLGLASVHGFRIVWQMVHQMSLRGH